MELQDVMITLISSLTSLSPIISLYPLSPAPEDYLAIDTTLTFGPGVTTIDIDVVIINDNADEENMEDFLSILQLITVRDNVDINPDQTTIIIVDDDRMYTFTPAAGSLKWALGQGFISCSLDGIMSML